MANLGNITIWIKGLVAAIIGGVANIVVLMIADPLNFNLKIDALSLFSESTTPSTLPSTTVDFNSQH